VFEVAPSLHMVELRKIGGDTLEFHNVCQHSNFYISETKKKQRKMKKEVKNSLWIGWKNFSRPQTNIAYISLIMWQFYKSFSSGLKDVVWKSDQTIEGLR